MGSPSYSPKDCIARYTHRSDLILGENKNRGASRFRVSPRFTGVNRVNLHDWRCLQTHTHTHTHTHTVTLTYLLFCPKIAIWKILKGGGGGCRPYNSWIWVGPWSNIRPTRLTHGTQYAFYANDAFMIVLSKLSDPRGKLFPFCFSVRLNQQIYQRTFQECRRN